VSWIWNNDQSQWQAMGTPPTCPTPVIPDGSLIRFNSVGFAEGPLSFVQPGQSRGGSYKPHGGYRWSEWNTYVPGVQVTVPFDGQVVGAWHYLVRTSPPEATGTADETTTYQFGVNIVNSCGVMIRLGHLNTPSAQFAGILSTLAPAVVDDSRESGITPVTVHAGDVIATSVGIPPPATSDLLGTFIDFGLLDLRAPNPLLAPDFTSNADVKYSKYSVCWYENELVGEGDRAATNSLPFSNGDGTSDYCYRDTEPTS
jgi:hypothetical protein